MLHDKADRTGVMHGGIPFPSAFRLAFGFERSLSFVAPRRQFLALDLARCAEAEGLDDKGMVVLLLALLVRPVAGPDMRLKNELIALAHVLGNGLSETLERHEPERV